MTPAADALLAAAGDGHTEPTPVVELGTRPADEVRRLGPPPGVPDPFRAFVERHGRAVYALAHRLTGDPLDADDLVQDVFVRAWDAFDALRDPEAAAGWLRRITVRLFLNTRRGTLRARFVRAPGGVLPEVPVAPTGDDPTFADAVARALGALSERERAAFVLRHLDDRSTAETAAALDVAEGTVKALLARAVRKMQERLRPYA